MDRRLPHLSGLPHLPGSPRPPSPRFHVNRPLESMPENFPNTWFWWGWRSANSIFKWQFHCRCRCGFLSRLFFRGEDFTSPPPPPKSVTLTRQSNRLKSDAKYPWIPKQYILTSISTVNMAKNNLFAISERNKRSNPMKKTTYREESKACE